MQYHQRIYLVSFTDIVVDLDIRNYFGNNSTRVNLQGEVVAVITEEEIESSKRQKIRIKGSSQKKDNENESNI